MKKNTYSCISYILGMLGAILLWIWVFQTESLIPQIIILICAGFGLGNLFGDLTIFLFKLIEKPLYRKEISESELEEAKTIIVGIDANKFSAKKARMNMEGAFEHNLERILEFIRVSSTQGDDHFTFKNGFPNYKEEMRPILEKLGYTVEVNGEFIKITWKSNDKELHD